MESSAHFAAANQFRAALFTAFTFCFVLCVLCVSAANAQSFPSFSASLPLGAYYRPGVCIPILIQSSQQSIHISAAGAIPADVQPADRNRIVPFLILSASTQSLRVGDREIAIRALNPDEKLVAAVPGIDVSAAAQLFPGQTIIPVMVNSDLTPASAWEALDAIILDRPMDAKLLPQILANGTTVVVRSDHRPDSDWPWKQLGNYWVLKADISGPINAMGGEVAYLPMQAWQAQQPAALRRQIVLAGVAVSLLMLATLLIRNRRSSIAIMLAIAVLCAFSIAAWRRAQPNARMPVGMIEVSRSGIYQSDIWRYIVAGTNGDKGDLPGEDRPFVFDVEHASLINLRIEGLSDGSTRWFINMPPKARLAVLKRRITPNSFIAPTSASRESPLYELARQAYLGRGMRIVGEIPQSISDESGAVELWPTVVIGPE